MMDELPSEATTIDPALREVGSGRNHQRLIFGKILPEQGTSLLVVQLLSEHKAGVIGRYYATQLNGMLLDEGFCPWSSKSLGEVVWNLHKREWVQVQISSEAA